METYGYSNYRLDSQTLWYDGSTPPSVVSGLAVSRSAESAT
jgi:hypothetical protein